LEKQEATK